MLYDVEGIFWLTTKTKQKRTQNSLLSLPLPHITEELQTALLECIFSGVKIF